MLLEKRNNGNSFCLYFFFWVTICNVIITSNINLIYLLVRPNSDSTYRLRLYPAHMPVWKLQTHNYFLVPEDEAFTLYCLFSTRRYSCTKVVRPVSRETSAVVTCFNARNVGAYRIYLQICKGCGENSMNKVWWIHIAESSKHRKCYGVWYRTKAVDCWLTTRDRIPHV